MRFYTDHFLDGRQCVVLPTNNIQILWQIVFIFVCWIVWRISNNHHLSAFICYIFDFQYCSFRNAGGFAWFCVFFLLSLSISIYFACNFILLCVFFVQFHLSSSNSTVFGECAYFIFFVLFCFVRFFIVKGSSFFRFVRSLSLSLMLWLLLMLLRYLFFGSICFVLFCCSIVSLWMCILLAFALIVLCSFPSIYLEIARTF